LNKDLTFITNLESHCGNENLWQIAVTVGEFMQGKKEPWTAIYHKKEYQTQRMVIQSIYIRMA
jgi:hypothetical protein